MYLRGTIRKWLGAYGFIQLDDPEAAGASDIFIHWEGRGVWTGKEFRSLDLHPGLYLKHPKKGARVMFSQPELNEGRGLYAKQWALTENQHKLIPDFDVSRLNR